jgi:selenocysteine-specific elongation factor
MTLAAPGRFAATIQLDAQLTLLPASRPLKRRSTVHFHHGSAECTAQVILLEQEKLAPGESGWAQLQLGAPVLALPGDRFILRQFSPVTTIGGGVVLDAHARRHKARDVSYRALLHAFAEGTHAVILQALCASEPRGLTHDQIVRRTGWTDAEVQTAAPELLETKAAILLNEAPLVLASAAAFERCVRGIAEELDRYHQANPLAPGVPREELRMRAARHAGPEIFRAALDHCLATGSAEITGDLVRRAGREIALLPEELQAKEAIAAAFAKAGLKVPPAKEVLAGLRVDARRAQKILQLLIREQTLVKVGEELLFHRAAITQLKEMLAAHKEKVAARISVPAFKEMAGISRKYAIPLLEYLDRERVTRRTGDERVIL